MQLHKTVIIFINTYTGAHARHLTTHTHTTHAQIEPSRAQRELRNYKKKKLGAHIKGPFSGAACTNYDFDDGPALVLFMNNL